MQMAQDVPGMGQIIFFPMHQKVENAVSVFDSPEFGSVRIVMREGDPWFVAKDIAERLGYSNSRKAVADHCKNPCAAGSNDPLHLANSIGYDLDPQTTLINQSDVLRLIVRSSLPEADRVERWIFEDVLPSVLKHGGYLTPEKIEEALLNPDTLIRLATDLKEERQKRLALEEKTERDRPKVIFADAVDASASTILVGDLAKLLRQNGIEIGQNRLFAWMRDYGYLMKKQGESHNMPTQRSMEMKLFEIKERTINNPDGSIRITKTVKVTGKGQIYFINLFKKR